MLGPLRVDGVVGSAFCLWASSEDVRLKQHLFSSTVCPQRCCLYLFVSDSFCSCDLRLCCSFSNILPVTVFMQGFHDTAFLDRPARKQHKNLTIPAVCQIPRSTVKRCGQQMVTCMTLFVRIIDNRQTVIVYSHKIWIWGTKNKILIQTEQHFRHNIQYFINNISNVLIVLLKLSNE